MTTLADYAAMDRRARMAKFIIKVLIGMGLTLYIAGQAYGGHNACAVQLNHHAVYAQPVVALQQIYPPAYYSVGAAIQEDAIAERVAAKVMERLAKAGEQPAEPGAPEPIPGEHAAITQSAVTQSCAKCHSGTNPKAGLNLTDPAALDCETRLKAIRAVLSQSMPKGATLTPEAVGQVLGELAGEEPPQPEGDSE